MMNTPEPQAFFFGPQSLFCSLYNHQSSEWDILVQCGSTICSKENMKGLENFNQCWILCVLHSKLTDTSVYLKGFKSRNNKKLSQYLSLLSSPQKWKIKLLLWTFTENGLNKHCKKSKFSTKYPAFSCKFRPLHSKQSPLAQTGKRKPTLFQHAIITISCYRSKSFNPSLHEMQHFYPSPILSPFLN